ncbi:hypothetical protein GT044_07285 [Streptomyces sp. SID335]|uniref:Uncharacterized protein n=2 Tax=Streptomyces TaxID=1883 RepID=A0A5P2BC14_STRVZ|nr:MULTISPECIES: putative leader peptide [unclassified Streptomyces]NEA00326.1 hypothetical protein [Streptomyces sp. SID10116]QES27480.1 hypothetical protein DEJ47_14355 [Streptomyces venezuelae]MYY81068.1 hypothetical protein [Streptomyces sp. SID335]MYZ19325.1 hypothetical protein [Streptomyces sp. SID337]NDZ87839.1 hypothetical protein [Streptomyces sp. SID10115]
MRSHSGIRTGNRYDDRMVPHDVSEETPSAPLLLAPLRSASTLLLGAFGCGAARLHVDLCRLASAICTR